MLFAALLHPTRDELVATVLRGPHAHTPSHRDSPGPYLLTHIALYIVIQLALKQFIKIQALEGKEKVSSRMELHNDYLHNVYYKYNSWNWILIILCIK